MERRADIEGLRALAVAVVLLFHFGVPGFDGGYVGVDVFFVISGFLITSLLIHEHRSTDRISVANFYARRARRILPISALVLASTAIAATFWLEPTRLENLATDTAGAALFGANFIFGERGADYLTANLPPSPILHYWSLAVEEQFYLVWPAFMIGLLALGRRARAAVPVGIGVVVAMSFAASVMLTDLQPSWSYYGLHTRAWEMALGALLAWAAPRIGSASPSLRSTAGWLGIVGIIVAAVTYGSASLFPGWIALLPVIATAAVIASGPDIVASPARMLSLAPLRWMGTRSYSLYLWHWPALILAESRAGQELTPLHKVLVAIGVVVVSEIGYRIVEQPIRHSRRLVADTPVSLLLGAFLVSAGVAASVLLVRHDPYVATGETVPPPTMSTASTTTLPAPVEPPPISNLDDGPLEAVVTSAAIKVVPDNLTPTLARADRDRGRRYTSCSRFTSKDNNEFCTLGDPEGTVKVALWGDSHAAQWEPAFEIIAKERGWDVLMMTRGGCGYIDILTYDFTDDTAADHCERWRKVAVEWIVKERIPVVFVSQYWGYSEWKTKRQINPAKMIKAHLDLVRELGAQGVEVVMLGDTPLPPGDTPSCLSARPRNTTRCWPNARKERMVEIREVAARETVAAGAGYIDTSRWICTKTACPAIVGNILVYRDNDHVSRTFMEWLAPVLSAAIVDRVEWVANR